VDNECGRVQIVIALLFSFIADTDYHTERLIERGDSERAPNPPNRIADQNIEHKKNNRFFAILLSKEVQSFCKLLI
jgi:hypothetical protein